MLNSAEAVAWGTLMVLALYSAVHECAQFNRAGNIFNFAV
jgi:hypothetical protein